mmetsp:Transcript_18660/g.51184  ORF Transcript_18660/g.51184 Transcript_18660/m.51184 type:complete len:240 (+) Transcript_18660:654-1373(+)
MAFATLWAWRTRQPSIASSTTTDSLSDLCLRQSSARGSKSFSGPRTPNWTSNRMAASWACLHGKTASNGNMVRAQFWLRTRRAASPPRISGGPRKRAAIPRSWVLRRSSAQSQRSCSCRSAPFGVQHWSRKLCIGVNARCAVASHFPNHASPLRQLAPLGHCCSLAAIISRRRTTMAVCGRHARQSTLRWLGFRGGQALSLPTPPSSMAARCGRCAVGRLPHAVRQAKIPPWRMSPVIV